MAVAIPFSYAGQATILTDEELDQVSAKGMPEIFWEILPIGSGDLGDYLTMLSQSSSGSYSLGNGNTVFTMGGQAQQNLQAMANINAVNSAVAYLINITFVNGDNFGEINQINNAVVSNVTNWMF